MLTESLTFAVTGHFAGVVLSASSFALVGTTPGKYLLGVEVRTFQGERLTFVDAMGREMRILFRGLGLSIPIVNLIAMGVAYGSLTSSGTAS